MKLIDDKKFLKDMEKLTTLRGRDAVEQILSKHLRDLPKKKKYIEKWPKDEIDMETFDHGYNQCLKDCEDK